MMHRLVLLSALAATMAAAVNISNTSSTEAPSTVDPSTMEATTLRPISEEMFAAANGAINYHVRTDRMQMASIGVKVGDSDITRYITPDLTGSATEALNLGYALGMGNDAGLAEEPDIGGEASSPLLVAEGGNLVLKTQDHGTVRLRRGKDMSFVSGADAQSTMNAVTLGYLLASKLNTKASKAELKVTNDALATLTNQVVNDIVAEVNKARTGLQDSIDDTQKARDLMQEQLEELIGKETGKRKLLAEDVADNTASIAEILKCAGQGQLYNEKTNACFFSNTVPLDATCDSNTVGAMRYFKGQRLEICDGKEFKSVEPELGSSANPASSCLQILQQGSPKDGVYFVNSGGSTVQRFCAFSPAVNTQSALKEFDFGTGADGDVTLNGGTHTIESLFDGYSWKDGKTPNWRKLTLNNGAVLTCNDYNHAARTGGAVIFKAATLSICSNCRVDVSGKGWRGASTRYGSSGYGSNVKNNDGQGPGAGEGGRGGNPLGCGAHGSGGGGGSSFTAGGIGTPDLPRCVHAVAGTGNTYNLKSNYWQIDNPPAMGSGGGAGGPGHPSRANCAPGNGGSGGGFVMISAKEVSNSGLIKSGGNTGLPDRNYCHWPNGNPQAGSGGAGAGGFVKLFSTSAKFGRIEVSPGQRPITQNWYPQRNKGGQRGGRGGMGRIVRVTVPWSCKGTCYEGIDCAEVKSLIGGSSGFFQVASVSGPVVSTYCDNSQGGGVDFGSGLDGDKTFSGGTHYINRMFSSYNPKAGMYPNWRNVRLTNGAVLTVDAWNRDTGFGGTVKFKVSGELTIDGSSMIDVRKKGYQGGEDWFTARDYRCNVKNNDGEGPGKGTGARGGNPFGCGAHGTGGGGGSFRTSGARGTPDMPRCNRADNYPPPGKTVAVSKWWEVSDLMGSGGGAGGPGHCSNAQCPPGRGGNGGGTISVSAKAVNGNGWLRADGENGQPDKPYCQWPNGNPQSGSGGAGSGGLIKLYTTSTSSIRSSANGGGPPLTQNWSPGNNRNGQRGGAGGSGHTIIVTVPKQ